MSQLRETIGRGFLLVAVASLFMVAPGCGAPEEITFVPPEDTVDGDDPGTNSLIEEDGAYLRQLAAPGSGEEEREGGQR